METESYGRKGLMVPLAELLKRELKNEKIDKPTIGHGQAGQSKKGEDFTLMKLKCQKIPGDESSTFAVFAVCSVSAGPGKAAEDCENAAEHSAKSAEECKETKKDAASDSSDVSEEREA